MKVNISNNNKRILTEFYNNSCFYSSFIFLTNIIVAYYSNITYFSFVVIL